MFYIGSDLRRIRIKAGKTTLQLAEDVGVKSRKTIENWENGMCEPTHNQFIIYVQSCGFDVAKVIDLFVQRVSLETEADLSKAHNS